MGRCMDKYDSTILGITFTRDSWPKGKGYYGVLCHDFIMEFYSYFDRSVVFLGGRRDRFLVPDTYINQNLELGQWTCPLVPPLVPLLFYLFQLIDPFFFIFYFFTYTHIPY